MLDFNAKVEGLDEDQGIKGIKRLRGYRAEILCPVLLIEVNATTFETVNAGQRQRIYCSEWIKRIKRIKRLKWI